MYVTPNEKVHLSCGGKASLFRPSLSKLSGSVSSAVVLSSSVAVVVVAKRSTDDEFSSTMTRGRLRLRCCC